MVEWLLDPLYAPIFWKAIILSASIHLVISLACGAAGGLSDENNTDFGMPARDRVWDE